MWGFGYRWHPLYWIGVPLALLTVSLLSLRGDDLTMAKFDQIEVGMNQDAVEDIMGDSLAGSSSMHGTVATGEDGDLFLEDGEMKWERNGKSITLTFREGKVVSKTQSGLK
jgi:hypothetical protein